MHVGKHYTLKEILVWTRREIYFLVAVATIATILHEVFEYRISLPWLPIAMIGTAVAFMVGFKNNATYGRLWEARQIWGAIINASRSFNALRRFEVRNLTTGERLNLKDKLED